MRQPAVLATKVYRQVFVIGRSLARVRETAAQLAAETKTQAFTPLKLELDEPSSVQSALAELVKQGPVERPSSTDCRVAPFRN